MSNTWAYLGQESGAAVQAKPPETEGIRQLQAIGSLKP